MSPANVINVSKGISAFKTNDRAITGKGLVPEVDTINPGYNLMNPGKIWFGGDPNDAIDGYIQQVYYLPERLPNAEMQTETV